MSNEFLHSISELNYLKFIIIKEKVKKKIIIKFNESLINLFKLSD